MSSELTIALAPMEGLMDALLRQRLTEVGGIDWCVTEFVRVTQTLLPRSVFLAHAPELNHGWSTAAGTPLRLQLLGSDPSCLADNAARACALGAPVVDLNFGCPARTVNRSRGGAVLLDEPDLLFRIVEAVRRSVPPAIPVTAKMRLGFADKAPALLAAQALASGGAAELVVHARTRAEAYEPPAHWEYVARIQDVVKVPVYANGEIWSLADFHRCVQISGLRRVMLGRGLVARPDLAQQIRADCSGLPWTPLAWDAVLAMLLPFWEAVRAASPARHAHGRIKQWLLYLARNYVEAGALFASLRRLTAAEDIELRLRQALAACSTRECVVAEQ